MKQLISFNRIYQKEHELHTTQKIPGASKGAFFVLGKMTNAREGHTH